MSNLSEYVKRATSGKSELTEVMERRKSAKAQELENLEFDALIAEAKKKLQDASPNRIDPSQATNFATMMFTGRTPAEIKEIIHSLTQEEIDKFAYMSARMDPNNFANMRGLLREPSTTSKDIVEAVKIGVEVAKKPESSGLDLKGIAEIFKAGVEAARVQQVPVQPQQDPMAIYKMVQEIVKPFQESASKHEKDLIDLRMREIESKIVNPIDYIKNVKAMSTELGYSTAGKNEMDLKLEEMKQTKELEGQKLDWEMKKWEMEKEKEGNTLETVKEILNGPVGGILKEFGSAGAARIRGNKAPPPNGQAQPPQIGQVKCPNCTGTFPANTQLPTIQCPLCGVQLQNGNQSAPLTPPQDVPKDEPSSDSAQAQPSQSVAQEKPTDQTLEVESPGEQISAKQ